MLHARTVIYRRIGDSSVELSVLGVGGHEFLPDGRLRGFQEDFALAITPAHIFAGFGGDRRRDVLKAAYDHGINFFDVTQDSEKEALGRNLRDMPPPFGVYVQTRPEAMMYDRDSGNRKMADHAVLKAEVERILRLLRRDRIDVLNLGITRDAFERDPDYFARLKTTVDALKRQGLIRFASADTFRGQDVYLRMIASAAFDTIFINLNLADAAGLDRVVPAARAARMGVIGREAFMKGELFRMGAEVGVTDRDRLARAALRWMLARPHVTAVVVGAAEAGHLTNALLALDGRDHDDDGTLIERLKTSPLFHTFESQRRREFLESAVPTRI